MNNTAKLRLSSRMIISFLMLIFLFSSGCNDLRSGIPEPDTMTWVGNYLEGYAENEIDNPIYLKVNVTSQNEWEDLMEVISFKSRYVDLDISDNTWSTEFNPGTFMTGKMYIVKLRLPNSIERIVDGRAANPVFRHFYNLDEIIIPKTVNYIGNYAFTSLSMLTTVIIPEAVTYIGNNAFAYCPKIAAINFPEKVTVIRNYTFRNTGLTNIVIPGSITEIGRYAFADCEFLNKVENPDDSIELIGEGAFSNCPNLNEFKIPSQVEDIKADTFRESGLLKITIPENITAIGSNAFQLCENLISIDIPAAVISIGSNAFNGCKMLTSITLPNIDDIKAGTFFNSAITSIVIPETVTAIGQDAFNECINLTEIKITLPEDGKSSGLETIGLRAFRNSGLISIIIPDTVKSIADSAFINCIQLSYVKLPDSIVSIGVSAFEGCALLDNIELPQNLTSIADKTFLKAGLRSVTIKDAVKRIGAAAFAENRWLTEVILPDGLENISNEAFKDSTSLHSITIPANVKRVGEYAFSNSGIEEITIPGSIPVIETGTFAGSRLKQISIPFGITAIESSAFSGARYLENVIIPDSVEFIRKAAFSFCIELKSVTFEGMILYENFSDTNPFPGDLRDKYFEKNGEPGIFKTTNPGINAVWVKDE